MAPTAAIVVVGVGVIDRDSSALFGMLSGSDVTPKSVATQTVAPQAETAIAAVVDVAPVAPAPAPTATTVVEATAETTAPSFPTTVEQLSAIVDVATAAQLQANAPEPELVTRAAPLSTSLLAETTGEEPVEVAATVPVIEDAAAFFANAQANLATESACGDDLRALADQARIYFPSGGLAGGDAGLAQARLIGQVLRDCPGYTIQVEGHSDPSGDPAINLRLSQQRAEAVVARLSASGIDTSAFIAKGFGDAVPSNVRGPESRAYYDRRVEFSVVEEVAAASFRPTTNDWTQSACAEQLAPIFASTKIFYNVGSITPPSGDMETAMQLAVEAAACDDVRLRIVGQHSDQPGAREGVSTGRLRALAIMNSLVAAGIDADQVLIGAPSWSESVPGQPGLPNSRVDFQLVLEGG